MEAPLPPRVPLLISPSVDHVAAGVYDRLRFLLRLIAAAFRPPLHGNEILRQCYEVGIRSLPLISLSGFIIGVVFTKQSRPSLASFGATSWLPSLVTIALVRSLASLVTALVCAGKVGSGIGAELGSMRVTEQIDAMQVSATDPFKFLVFTRTVATTLMTPVLAIYCCAIGLVGAYVNIRAHEATSVRTFLDNGFSTITFLDVGSGVVKALLFGFTIGLVSSYEGYNASHGTQGVGRAANTSVVVTMFALFVEEALLVQIISAIRGS